MSDKSGIQWTDASWNPVTGCTKVSQGCKNCYAEPMFERLASQDGNVYTGRKFTDVACHPERLVQPLRWARGRVIFVNSMSDLFHESVPFEFIASVFAVMGVTCRHTYQILTKRPDRMLAFFDWVHDEVGLTEWAADERIRDHWPEGVPWEGYDNCGPAYPYQNVWLGVSVEDQATADERIPKLLETPAAVRFISAEPLLAPVDLADFLGLTWEKCGACGCRYPDVYWADDAQWAQVVGDTFGGLRCPACFEVLAKSQGFTPKYEILKPPLKRLDWVIAGGESGPKARAAHPGWFRSLRDQCAAAGVPFWFKQWGSWVPWDTKNDPDLGRRTHRMKVRPGRLLKPDGTWHKGGQDTTGARLVAWVGKKVAGNTLDGEIHEAAPAIEEWPSAGVGNE